MSDFLYYTSQSSASRQIESATSATQNAQTVTVQHSTNWWDNLSNIDLTNFSFFPILSTLNYFFLAWIIVHTALLLTESYLYYFKFAALDDFLENQQTGHTKFMESWELWKDYIFAVLFFLFYVLTYKIPILGVIVGALASIYYFYAFVFKSLPKTPILDVFQGKDNSIIGRAVQTLKKVVPKKDTKKDTKKSGEKDDKSSGNQSLLGGIISGLGGIGTDVVQGLAGGKSPEKTDKK